MAVDDVVPTGSGRASVCSCRAVQARAAREKTTLFGDLAAPRHPFTDLKLSKVILDELETSSGLWENLGIYNSTFYQQNKKSMFPVHVYNEQCHEPSHSFS